MTNSNSSTKLVEKWVPILGRWTVNPGAVVYEGPSPASPHSIGICVSDTDLTDGHVSTEIRVSAGCEGRLLLGYRSPTERYIMAGIGGWNFAYTIGEYEPALGWRGLAMAGSAANLSDQHLYNVAATIAGQRISLSIDGVRVLDHVLKEPMIGGQLGLFAVGTQPVKFGRVLVDRIPGTVFVVMQFSDPYKQLYDEVISPVASSFELRAYHVGEVFGPGMILHDIAQGIVGAKIVVAEITPANQNVFYELGYAHALGKPTILLAERGKQLPFDISGYRVLFYENTIAGKKQVEDGFRKHLTAILRD